MSEASHRRQTIRTDADVGALRRSVVEAASRCPGLRPGDAALVATELGTNLVRHARPGGYVLFRGLEAGIELLAVDHGPGMRRAALARTVEGRVPPQPGRRRSGLGVGLAGVEHLATEFDLYSVPEEGVPPAPGAGTVVLARLLTAPRRRGWWRWGAVNVPLGGVGESGDSWAVVANHLLAAVVVDGLGHGPEAARAAAAAVTAFEEAPPRGATGLERFLGRAHEAMRSTRGGAVAVCVIDPGRRALFHAGVGNVSGRVLLAAGSKDLLGHAGTLGAHAQRHRGAAVEEHWEPGAMVILASDGLQTRWDPLAYRGLWRHDPSVVAATLVRDHARARDDATVLVIQDLRDARAERLPATGAGTKGER